MTVTFDKTGHQHIGVLVEEGCVTLHGYVTSYGEKSNGLGTVKRVSGAVAIADNLEIQLPGSVQHTDGDVEQEEAERVAWAAPGVTMVENHLKPAWPWGEAERVAWAALGVTMVENHLKPAWPWGFDD